MGFFVNHTSLFWRFWPYFALDVINLGHGGCLGEAVVSFPKVSVSQAILSRHEIIRITSVDFSIRAALSRTSRARFSNSCMRCVNAS